MIKASCQICGERRTIQQMILGQMASSLGKNSLVSLPTYTHLYVQAVYIQTFWKNAHELLTYSSEEED